MAKSYTQALKGFSAKQVQKPAAWRAPAWGNANAPGKSTPYLPVAAPAPAPAAVPAPAPAPAPPVDPGAIPLGAQVALDAANQAALANYSNTVAGITNSEDRTASDFGYKVDYSTGANGARTVTNLSVDPTNPFSRAAALQRSYDQAKEGSTNSYAARGQLYAGSLQNAQNENTYQFAKGENALRQSFIDFIARSEQARTAAEIAKNNAASAAQADALNAAASSAPIEPRQPTESEWAALFAKVAAEKAAQAAPATLTPPQAAAKNTSTAQNSAASDRAKALEAQARAEAKAKAAAKKKRGK